MASYRKTKKSKTVALTLTDKTVAMLKELAERNSSSMSYEVRRLVQNEYEKIKSDK